jgi:hypothetical protein
VARLEGVAASVWYSLSLVEPLFGTPVPREGRQRLQPALVVRLLYSRLWPLRQIAALQARRHRRAVQFDAAESWRGMLPNLVLMGRRGTRAASALRLLRPH